MSALTYVHDIVIPTAMKMVPWPNTPEAQAMLLATGLQESLFQFRLQQPNGPAKSLWQFEKDGGVKGVLNHHATKPILKDLIPYMGYAYEPKAVYDAMEHNDVLACIMARGLLFTHPNALPLINQPNKGWVYYITTWRPGRPHSDTWEGNFKKAWDIVKGG